ncbi:MAG TPA: cation:proton antiporter, partial [Candidatus Krumholzibacteria bacterium]
MNAFDLHTPAMTVAIALLVGMVGQSLAYHLRMPGIVILLLFGVLLGPDGLNVVDPSVLGDGLRVLVGFAITVVLFEAGLNFDLGQFRAEMPAIRRLATIGALVTFASASLLAGPLLLQGTRSAVLVGALVIATGPGVILPLLRRIRVRRNLQMILEGEGVFVEGIGAIIALLVLHITFVGQDSPAHALAGVVTGVTAGIAGGSVMVLLLRWRRVVASGMEKAFALALAWATFVLGNAASADSGALAVLIAGMMATNSARETMRGVREQKDMLAPMIVSAFLVLIAAQSRVADMAAVGWRAAALV